MGQPERGSIELNQHGEPLVSLEPPAYTPGEVTLRWQWIYDIRSIRSPEKGYKTHAVSLTVGYHAESGS